MQFATDSLARDACVSDQLMKLIRAWEDTSTHTHTLASLITQPASETLGFHASVARSNLMNSRLHSIVIHPWTASLDSPLYRGRIRQSHHRYHRTHTSVSLHICHQPPISFSFSQSSGPTSWGLQPPSPVTDVKVESPGSRNHHALDGATKYSA